MRAILACSLLTFAACESDKDADTGSDTTDTTDTVTDTTDTTDTTTEPPPPPPIAFLRFLNAAEPFGTTDVYVDGAVRTTLAPLDSTSFANTTPGSHNVGMAPEGADPTKFGVVTPVDFPENSKSTLVLIGEPADGALISVTEDATALAQTENRLWFVHGGLGAPPIDVIDVATDTVLVNDLAYGASAVVVAAAGPTTFGVDIGNDGVDLTYDFTGGLQRVFIPLVFTFTTPDVTTGTPAPQLALIALTPQGTETVFLPQSVPATTASP